MDGGTRRGGRRDLAEDLPEPLRKLPGDLVPDAHQRGSHRRFPFIGSNGLDDALQELLGAASEVDRQCGRIGPDTQASRVSSCTQNDPPDYPPGARS